MVAIFFADSCKAQPLHTDEGYTTKIPHYVSLFCSEPSENGGINTLVSINDVLVDINQKFSKNLEKAFHTDAMLVESAHGKIYKPLFFYYGSNKVGIAYSPLVKRVDLSLELSELFMTITDYIHDSENQFRIKLNKGDLLILDNCRMLHGRTSFDNDSKRSFQRFWFSPKFLKMDLSQ